MRTTLRSLDVYRALMTHRSISKAAVAMNLTQPAVTKALNSLEDRLQLTLFERGRQGCVPTPEAEQLFHVVDNLFDIHGSVERLAEDLRMKRSGHLRLVTNPALSLGFIARIINIFKKEYPTPSIVLRTVPARLIPEMVGSHQVDIGLVLFPLSDETTTCEILVNGEFRCIFPRSHPLANEEVITPEQISHFEYISFPHRMGYGRLLSERFAENNLVHSPSIRVDTSAAACALAQELGGLAIVDNFVLEESAFSGLISRPLAESPGIPVGICYPSLRPPSLLAQSFLEIVRRELKPSSV